MGVLVERFPLAALYVDAAIKAAPQYSTVFSKASPYLPALLSILARGRRERSARTISEGRRTRARDGGRAIPLPSPRDRCCSEPRLSLSLTLLLTVQYCIEKNIGAAFLKAFLAFSGLFSLFSGFSHNLFVSIQYSRTVT